jgi:hypothetical protein
MTSRSLLDLGHRGIYQIEPRVSRSPLEPPVTTSGIFVSRIKHRPPLGFGLLPLPPEI